MSRNTSTDTALPPDVRLWLRPADRMQLTLGLCPWFGLCPGHDGGFDDSEHLLLEYSVGQI